MNSEIMHNDDYPTQEFEPIIIVKIGGSVISDKKIPYSLRIEILDQLIEQIRILFMQNQKQMILVHGGGSYGHPIAKEYSIQFGRQEIDDQILGLAKTHNAMHELNGIFIKKLIDQHVPAISLQPSTCFISQSDNNLLFTATPQILSALQMGCLPVLYGDILFHSTPNFSIISGDQIIVELVKALALIENFQVQKVIFCIDKDGILTLNKKTHNFDVIDHLKFGDLDNLKIFNQKDSIDVTDSLKGKLAQIKLLSDFSCARANPKRSQIGLSLKGISQ